MKSRIRVIGVAAGVLMLAGVQNAGAQLLNAVEFTTAFPFTVGNATVPAGSYTITPDDDNPAVLEMAGAHEAVLFETKPTEARDVPSRTEVVFLRYGDTYVLKNIWIQGLNSGAETNAAEGERHAEKHHGSKSEQRVAARQK
jgi:hypothetical protein